jgi:hypothetical protein
VRISELCGIAIKAPDGLPDLMLDSVERGRGGAAGSLGWGCQKGA